MVDFNPISSIFQCVCVCVCVDSVVVLLIMARQIQYSPLNSHGKCAEKSCKLSKHVNYQSLFYVTFLSMAEGCVQSKCAN